LRWIGYTDNYIRVQGYGPAHLFNSVTPVRLEEASADGLQGVVL